MEHVGIRIKQFRETHRLTQTDVFHATGGPPDGIKQTTLSSIESGTEPKYGILAAILRAYPALSSDWLINGEGPMLRGGKTVPVEAPTTAAPKTTQLPTAGIDPELFKEVKDSRDKAWEIVDKKDEELTKERAEKEYYRELWMQQVFGDQHGNAPATALPGKTEADSFAAVPTSEPMGKTYLGFPERDETGAVKTTPKAKLTTDHLQLMDSGELRQLVVAPTLPQERAIGLLEDEAEAA